MLLRIFILVSFFAMFPVELHAQDDPKTWFDFWIGEWTVRWKDEDGTTGTGTNSVVRILDNTVIQENFRAETGTLSGYKGTSLSVYNPAKQSWHQGYADNQGAYFNFTGSRDGDKRIFQTAVVDRDGKKIVQRMVFSDISDETITWDWELSEDGGLTWNLKWKIYYARVHRR